MSAIYSRQSGWCFRSNGASVLAERLAELTAAGLVARTVDEGPPLAVSYALTDRGEALIPALTQISVWAEEHLVTVRPSSAPLARPEVRQRVHEALELLGRPTLEHAVAVRLVGGHHRVAVVPVELGLRVEPEGSPGVLGDRAEGGGMRLTAIDSMAQPM